MVSYNIAHLVGTSAILFVIILVTVVGNVFVVAAIVLERNLRSVANYLIASLAVADLMVAALVMPLAAVNEVSAYWSLGNTICDAWIAFDVLCCTSSILHLAAISLDRYWAVTRVDYIHNRSAQRMLLMIAFSWGISTVISIPPLFGSHDPFLTTTTTTNMTSSFLTTRTNMTSFLLINISDANGSTSAASYRGVGINRVCLITQDLGYTVFSTVGAFYIPLLFMLVVYVNIYRTARFRIRKRQFNKQPVKRTPADNSCSDVEMDVSGGGGGGIHLNFPTSDGQSGVSASSFGADGPNLIVPLGAVASSPASSSARYLSAANIICASGFHLQSLISTSGLTSQVVPPHPSPSRRYLAVDDSPAAGGYNSTGTAGGHSPPSTRSPSVASSSKGSSWLDVTRDYLERRRSGSSAKRAERKYKERRAQIRERKAARTLAIITGTFVICWLPFFTLSTVRPFCGQRCRCPPLVTSIVAWLGYCNSLLNPIIYTIFNPDFRSAFRKILFGKYRRHKQHANAAVVATVSHQNSAV